MKKKIILKNKIKETKKLKYNNMIITIPNLNLVTNEFETEPEREENFYKCEIDNFVVYELKDKPVNENSDFENLIAKEEQNILEDNKLYYYLLRISDEVEKFYFSYINSELDISEKTCFICKNHSFPMDSLLQFKNFENLLAYLKFIMIFRKKLLIINELKYSNNLSEIFDFIDAFNDNLKKKLTFEIPKYSCKFCLLEILNKKNALSKLLNLLSIYSNIEINENDINIDVNSIVKDEKEKNKINDSKKKLILKSEESLMSDTNGKNITINSILNKNKPLQENNNGKVTNIKNDFIFDEIKKNNFLFASNNNGIKSVEEKNLNNIKFNSQNNNVSNFSINKNKQSTYKNNDNSNSLNKKYSQNVNTDFNNFNDKPNESIKNNGINKNKKILINNTNSNNNTNFSNISKNKIMNNKNTIFNLEMNSDPNPPANRGENLELNSVVSKLNNVKKLVDFSYSLINNNSDKEKLKLTVWETSKYISDLLKDLHKKSEEIKNYSYFLSLVFSRTDQLKSLINEIFPILTQIVTNIQNINKSKENDTILPDLTNTVENTEFINNILKKCKFELSNVNKVKEKASNNILSEDFLKFFGLFLNMGRDSEFCKLFVNLLNNCNSYHQDNKSNSNNNSLFQEILNEINKNNSKNSLNENISVNNFNFNTQNPNISVIGNEANKNETNNFISGNFQNENLKLKFFENFSNNFNLNNLNTENFRNLNNYLITNNININNFNDINGIFNSNNNEINIPKESEDNNKNIDKKNHQNFSNEEFFLLKKKLQTDYKLNINSGIEKDNIISIHDIIKKNLDDLNIQNNENKIELENNLISDNNIQIIIDENVPLSNLDRENEDINQNNNYNSSEINFEKEKFSNLINSNSEKNELILNLNEKETNSDEKLKNVNSNLKNNKINSDDSITIFNNDLFNLNKQQINSNIKIKNNFFVENVELPKFKTENKNIVMINNSDNPTNIDLIKEKNANFSNLPINNIKLNVKDTNENINKNNNYITKEYSKFLILKDNDDIINHINLPNFKILTIDEKLKDNNDIDMKIDEKKKIIYYYDPDDSGNIQEHFNVNNQHDNIINDEPIKNTIFTPGYSNINDTDSPIFHGSKRILKNKGNLLECKKNEN